MIKHFYFSPLILNFQINKFPSVTDKTFFRPDVLTVRSNETDNKKPLYHFKDGKYDRSLDLSALSHFPERVEVAEMVDKMKYNLEKQVQADIDKNEMELQEKFDKDFKQTVIDSISGKNVDSASDSASGS